MLLLQLFVCLTFRLYEGKIGLHGALGKIPDIAIYVPPRGNIYIQDTAGQREHLVATNKNAFVLGANPNNIESGTSILNNINLDIESEERNAILGRLTNKKRVFVPIADRLTQEQKETIERKRLQGVEFQTHSFRYYPSNSLASHIIGYFGYSNKSTGLTGVSGVEGFFNEELTGKSGFAQVLPERGITESSVFAPGSDVILTIDQAVQFKVEQELAKVAEDLEVDFASAIFMDPKTGKILAMASFPSFNPNTYNEIEDISVFRNHTIQSSFEMGSIFKPLTMAFGIDAGAITPQTTYDDPGVRIIDGHRITNYDDRSHGENLTMTRVLELSLNTGTVFALDEMGTKVFSDYVQRFQLGKKTGIELAEEAGNRVVNVTDPNVIIQSNYATASYGHGVQFTPIRMLTSFAALANDGVIMKPYVVEKIIDKNGEVVYTEPEEIVTPISTRTAQQVTKMLVSTAENGYGSRLRVPGYNIAAKTGTAQIARSGYYTADVRHSFIGYAPAYDPEVYRYSFCWRIRRRFSMLLVRLLQCLRTSANFCLVITRFHPINKANAPIV